jgi:hypothetical protein
MECNLVLACEWKNSKEYGVKGRSSSKRRKY